MSKHISILTGVALAAALTATAQTPLWLRNPDISPDGSAIAFQYKGDIFTVPVGGGRAQQLTTNAAYDAAPKWSPDGKWIAFSSDRVGHNTDIYVIPAQGGTARRVTTASTRENLLGWLNDSTLLYSASGPGSPTAIVPPSVGQVYTVSVNGGATRLYAHLNMSAADADTDGRLVYQDKKGFENIFRKHERSAGTNDVWIKDGEKYTKLTDFNGHDNNPVWLDKNGTIAYVSEQDGTLNVWTMNSDGSGKKQLTHLKDFPVRSLSAADNGTMAFSWDGSLYTLRPGGEPKRVDVTIVSDDYDADSQTRYLTYGADNIEPSADAKQVALIVRGDVYVTDTKYKTTKRVTNTPGQERCLTFAPDGRTLVYDSERDGQWGLYKATIKNKDEKQFAYATDVVEEPLYIPADGKPAQQPVFSPDGKKVAFLEDRCALRVLDVASGTVTTALPAEFNYSYTDGDISFCWSPDSRWLLADYIGVGGWNNTDIALVKADGTEVVDLTESGYSDGSPQWAMDGRAITYRTGKYGMRSHGSWGEQSDFVVMMLDGDAWDEFNRTEEEAALAKAEKDEKAKAEDKKDSDKKKNKKDKKGKKDAKADKPDVKPLTFDLDNRRYRTRRLTNMSGSMGSYWLNNDGTKLYYTTIGADGKGNLMVRDMRKGEIKVLVPGFRGGFVPDVKGENLFAISGMGVSKISLPDGKQDNVEYEALYDRHPSLERLYIYDHMASQVADKFHDTTMHGCNWAKVVEDYRKFLPYINNNADFAELMSEALGELNASHTGSGYRSGGADMPTAQLGAYFDQNYDGPGLRVVEVIPRTPLADKRANVKAGDIITAIDGTEIAPGADYAPLLMGKTGKKVRLTVKRTDGTTGDITIKPKSIGTQLYQRWVERNEHIVDSLSNGRIGYVHVEGMDSPSFREVYSKLLGKYRNCDAVVVDTRWNGGGWLHNDIALLLSGKEYVRYTPRGRYIGSDPFSQWTKPSVMLVNESNYSDAHGTPYVYQTLGIGKIVGAPVPGTMTAVWWETQVDPSLYFGIPQVTSLDRNGNMLENKQLNPDIVVYNDPADVQRGVDAQLEAAVKELLKQVDANKGK